MLLGLVDNDSPDLSGFATKQELQDAVTELQPVDEVTVGNMQSVTSNAVFQNNGGYRIKTIQIDGTTNFVGILDIGNIGIPINFRCSNKSDYMYLIGYGFTAGYWLKIVNYDYNPVADSYITGYLTYLEPITS
jgi:hypothetical protein